MKKAIFIILTFFSLQSYCQNRPRLIIKDTLVNMYSLTKNMPKSFGTYQVTAEEISGITKAAVLFQILMPKLGYVTYDSLVLVDVKQQAKLFKDVFFDRIVIKPSTGNISLCVIKIYKL